MSEEASSKWLTSDLVLYHVSKSPTGPADTDFGFGGGGGSIEMKQLESISIITLTEQWHQHFMLVH